MKRGAVFGIAAMLCFALCACANQPSANTAETTAPATESRIEETTMNPTPEKTEIKELSVEYNGGLIYGKAYIADVNQKSPLVIMSHGLGANHQRVADYARDLQKNGYSSYIFDFPNGSSPFLENKSGTDTTKMSVMTEVDALEAVYAAAKTWDFADFSRVYLLGESQGGLVASLVAMNHPGELSGLLLLYPGFNIPDYVRNNFDSLDDVPSEYDIFGWITVGKIYAEDVWDLDVYSGLQNYQGRTLIIHGDNDEVVDVSYSEIADEVMPDCELYILNGAGHGFSGEYFDSAMETILEFMN